MNDTELARRLEKLERDNRRLKKLGAAAFVLAAALGAIAATRPVPDVITSHKFVLVDQQGRARVTISTPAYAGAAIAMNADDPAIWLSDNKGNDRAILTTDSLRFADAKGKSLGAFPATDPVPQKITAREFDAVDASGKVRATLSTLQGVGGEPTLTLTGQNRQVLLEGPGLVMLLSNSQEGSSGITIGASHGLSNIMLADRQGFEMDLGSAKTVAPKTGATQQTSAASIIMFGNDKEHHVIWKAP